MFKEQSYTGNCANEKGLRIWNFLQPKPDKYLGLWGFKQLLLLSENLSQIDDKEKNLSDCIPCCYTKLYIYIYIYVYIYITMHLSDTSSIAQHLKKHSCPTTELRKILTENTTIIEHQNNKQKLQIPEALDIRNMQPKLNGIYFQTNANVLKCL